MQEIFLVKIENKIYCDVGIYMYVCAVIKMTHTFTPEHAEKINNRTVQINHRARSASELIRIALDKLLRGKKR